jgi:ABC-type transporter Mla subunit MlaD
MMKLVKAFFALLRRIAGLEDDIEKIVKPITDIVDKLGEHAKKQEAAARKADEESARLAREAESRKSTAGRASELADKYRGLIAS